MRLFSQALGYSRFWLFWLFWLFLGKKKNVVSLVISVMVNARYTARLRRIESLR